MLHNCDNDSSRQIRILLIWVLSFAALLTPALASQSVTLAWDPSPDADITGYRLKYGTSSGSYTQSLQVGNTTTATVPNLTAGATYFFAVTAFNSASMESAPSNEVTFIVIANQPPTVSITSPASGTSVFGPANVTLGATASDSDGTVSKVEFFSGATKIGESSASPYSYPCTLSIAGTYSFTARAIDNEGASASSTPVTLTILEEVVSKPLGISSVTYQASSGAQVTVTGTAGQTQSVYVSNDLKSWTLLSTITNVTGTTKVSDLAATYFGARFYKVTDGTTTTDPIGFTKLRIAGTTGTQSSATSYLGINLVNPPSYKGMVTSRGSRTIADAEAVWTEGQFNGANGEHYLEILSGPHAGTTTDVLSTSAATGTLTTDDDLSPLLAGGERFVIRKHRTIGDIFGKGNEAGLKAGTSLKAADEVRLFNPVTQSFLDHYYNSSGAGWRTSTNASADASKTKLYLDQGVVIRRKTTGDVTLIVTGAVKSGQTMVPIGVNSNLCANMYATGGLTLANCGLYNGTSSALAGSTKINTADEVQIWSGSAFKRYFYKSGGTGGTGWRLSSNTKADAGSTQILPGSSIYVLRKSGRPAFNWKMPQPF